MQKTLQKINKINLSMQYNNTRFLLVKRPVGMPGDECWELSNQQITTLEKNEILIEARYLSIDPYMRGRMNEGVSYATPAKLGEPMTGETAGVVIESNSNSRFRRVEIPTEFISQSYSDLFDYYRKLNGSLLIGVFAEDENLGIGAILSSDASALDSFIERKLKEGGINLQEESKINVVINPSKDYTIKEGERAIIIP